jgi:hypothetical protein
VGGAAAKVLLCVFACALVLKVHTNLIWLAIALAPAAAAQAPPPASTVLNRFTLTQIKDRTLLMGKATDALPAVPLGAVQTRGDRIASQRTL